MTAPKNYAVHACQYSILAWLLAQFDCSSPSTKVLHGQVHLTFPIWWADVLSSFKQNSNETFWDVVDDELDATRTSTSSTTTLSDKNGLSLNDNKSNNKWNESFILFSPSFSSLNGSIVFCSRKRKLTVRTQCWDLHPTYYWLVNCFYYARYQWWWWRWLTRLWRSNRSAKVVPLWAVTLLLLRS